MIIPSKRGIVLALAFIGLVSMSIAQKDSTSTKGGLMNQALVGPRIVAARVEFNKNNIRGALTIYREILETEPNNSNALFGISECHYNLKRYKLALEYLDKAVAIDPKVSSQSNLYYGQIHHRTAQMDEAIVYYRKYQEKYKAGSYDYLVAQRYIDQCEYAKKMMKTREDVTIKNLGEEINSRYDDYTPSISSDGKTLIFTARRIDTKGGRTDTDGDYKHFEDIYYSTWNDETNEWNRAEAVEGDLNTDTHDAVLSIFPDGSGMYVYKNTVNTTGDIYYSLYNKETKQWQAAVKMPRPINSTYFESSTSITADGNTIYFVSERPEGHGQSDIYTANKVGSGWSSPKNLGTVINTELDEKFVFIHPNGKTLFFASDGHLTMGSYDIFKSELVNGVWSRPINLGYPINTVNEESTFSLTSDNKTLMIAAEYDDSFGERDIYAIDVSRYPLISQGYEQSSFGQIAVTFYDKNGKSIKGAIAEILASDGISLDKKKTTRMGEAKFTMEGNKQYKIVLTDGAYSDTKQVDLRLNPDGETIVTVEFRKDK